MLYRRLVKGHDIIQSYPLLDDLHELQLTPEIRQ